jgi:putative ABC transporter
MKQKLRLAQAFMENPEILILDEPFNALDKDTVTKVQNKIQNEKENGKTILLTSHDERNINLLCNIVFEMDCGKIIEKKTM